MSKRSIIRERTVCFFACAALLLVGVLLAWILWQRAAAQTPRYRELRVATSDGLEQSQVLSSGAIRMTSRELLRELREMRKSGMSAHQNQPYMNRNTIFSRMPEDIRARLEKLRRGE